jgi:hypothetical protein
MQWSSNYELLVVTDSGIINGGIYFIIRRPVVPNSVAKLNIFIEIFLGLPLFLQVNTGKII